MSERGPGTRDLPLFQKHSPTSKAAWQKAPKVSDRTRVYDMIRERGEYGATDKEMQAVLKLEGSTQRPRRVELVEAKWVRDSGRVRANCTVWVAV